MEGLGKSMLPAGTGGGKSLGSWQVWRSTQQSGWAARAGPGQFSGEETGLTGAKSRMTGTGRPMTSYHPQVNVTGRALQPRPSLGSPSRDAGAGGDCPQTREPSDT